MNKKTERDKPVREELIRVGDISESLLSDAGTCVQHYSVGIVSLYMEGQKPRTALIGSGSLVHKGDSYGILTAAHVIDERKSPMFRRAERIGLAFKGSSHSWHESKDRFSYEILAYQPDERGPDIAFIRIPGELLGQLKARKSFWNLDKYREELSSLPPIRMGVWTLFGCPAEGVHKTAPSAQFHDLLAIPGLSGFAGIDEDETVDGFDYYRFVVSYAAGSNPPADFGGVSGGGLWQVPIRKNSDGTLTYDHPILSGVAFWQSPVESNERFILCHGRESIYRRAYDAM